MLKFGIEPILECSSKGDKRFSALFARIKARGDKTIEDIYQNSKVFEDGSTGKGRSAKGKRPVNIEECRTLYSTLWDEYFLENPSLLKEIKKFRGFSDVFGQKGSACQAEEIYRIWIAEMIRIPHMNMKKFSSLILNKNRDDIAGAIYCGRGSPYGNRFATKGSVFSGVIYVDSREEAVAQHRADILAMMNTANFQAFISPLRGKRVYCYCSPELCHCATLVAAANLPPIKLNHTGKYVSKDQLKADVAHSFIGIGSKGSSTHAYSQSYGVLANKGHYINSEVVFVSVNGNRPDRVRLESIVSELRLALASGAKLLTDTPDHRNRPYNVGEQELAAFLTLEGCTETVCRNYSEWKL